MNANRSARFLIRVVGAAAVAVLGLAISPDQGGAAQWTSTDLATNPISGSITLVGTLGTSVELTVSGLSDSNALTKGATCASATVLPGDAASTVVNFGTVSYNCADGCSSGDCYRIGGLTGNSAFYVATLDAALNCGSVTCGLDMYFSNAGNTATQWADGSIRYTTDLLTTAWTTTTAGTPVPLAALGTGNLVTAASTVSTLTHLQHQIAARIDSTDTINTTKSATIVYQVF